jgi:cytochrome c biogenesis protein CcmG, thiol:disulfide interchange protein DsbE
MLEIEPRSNTHGPSPAGPVPASSPTEPGGHARQEHRFPKRLRMPFRTLAVGGLIATVVGILGYFGGLPTGHSLQLTARIAGPAPRIGKEAPDFRVIGLDGAPIQLSEFRGRPVLLTFWATWCPPCRAESPDMEAVYEQYQDTGLVIMAVDVGENPVTVRGYAQRAGLTFMIALDQKNEAAGIYRIAGPPTHYFIDAEGIIRDWQNGSMSKQTIEKKVSTILPTGGKR